MSGAQNIIAAEVRLNDQLLNIKGQLRELVTGICGPIPPSPLPQGGPTLGAPTPTQDFIASVRSTQEANAELMADLSHIINFLRDNFIDEKSAGSARL